MIPTSTHDRGGTCAWFQAREGHGEGHAVCTKARPSPRLPRGRRVAVVSEEALDGSAREVGLVAARRARLSHDPTFIESSPTRRAANVRGWNVRRRGDPAHCWPSLIGGSWKWWRNWRPWYRRCTVPGLDVREGLSRERGLACRPPGSALSGRRRWRQEHPHPSASQWLDNSLGYTVQREGHGVNKQKQWPHHLWRRVGATTRRRRHPLGACRLHRCGNPTRAAGAAAGWQHPAAAPRRGGTLAPCRRYRPPRRAPPPSACARAGACFSTAPAVAAAVDTAAGAAPRTQPVLCPPPPPSLQWKLLLAGGDGGDCGLPREGHRAGGRKSGRADRRGRRGGEAASGRCTAGAAGCQGAAGGQGAAVWQGAAGRQAASGRRRAAGGRVGGDRCVCSGFVGHPAQAALDALSAARRRQCLRVQGAGRGRGGAWRAPCGGTSQT